MKNDRHKSKVSMSFIIAKRLRVAMLITLIVFFLLLIRIGWLQFIQGAELKEAMYDQLIASDVISPKRGTIYDSTGVALAISAQVDTVTINPKRIVITDDYDEIDEEKTGALKEKVAKMFSDIFGLDYANTFEKVTSDSTYATIASKVEKDKIDRLRQWMKKEEFYSGITITEDTKRYYPYENLASTLIGFCGTDNQGLEGLERAWDDTLTGTPGKVVASKDAVRDYIPEEQETYVAPENGSNLTLTIDSNIQSIVEKYLKQGCIENNCKRGGNAIVMNPKNGDILAMATYPDYNLNTPFTPTHLTKEEWKKLNSEAQYSTLTSLYRNRAISDPYEPGSVFKIITAAAALEENIDVPDKAQEYDCKGYYTVSGMPIYCSVSSGHGKQSLRDALANSCNPAFMQLAQKIGATTLYKYYEAFGFLDETEVDSVGENVGVIWAPEDIGPIELATMSFGQRFTVNPLQMITAICSVANNGILMKPRIVKEITNTDTGATTTVDPIEVRQVISKETAETMLNMLETVITDGTGKYAKVKGYSIAGKTGTSEPAPGTDDGNTASFAAISPVENPEVVVLLTFYHPQGSKGTHGSDVAAPVAGQILAEVLPYLQIPSDSSNGSSGNSSTSTLPDVTNKTVSEAKKILENAGFTCSTSADSSDLVTEQYPVKGTSLLPNSIVKLYSSEENTKVSKSVPDLLGKSLSQVKNVLREKNLNVISTGSGIVISQDPIEGTSVEEGTVIKVTLSQ